MAFAKYWRGVCAAADSLATLKEGGFAGHQRRFIE